MMEIADINTIPSELRALRQWVVWRYVKRGDDKPTKVPFQPNGEPASSTDPATWTSFGEVLEVGQFDGIGFVFADGGPYVGIDLDDSIGGDGNLKPWGQSLVDRFATYTEISPSGQGVKLWCRAKYPSVGTGKRKPYRDGAVEMYHKGRYFTVTGRRYPGTPDAITFQQSGVDGLFNHILSPKPKVVDKPTADMTDRCVKYIEKCPDAVSGQSGHDKTFYAACICFRFGLSDTEVWRVMEWFNSAKCSPPWSPKELAHKVDDARAKVNAAGEFGSFGRTIETPPIPVSAPPKESSALLERINGAITGKRTNIEWPWPILTKAARALVPGTVTVLCGMGGSSKSLMVSEACLHWLAVGVPFAAFHLEEDREFHQLRALAQLDQKATLTQDEWQNDNPDCTLEAYDRHHKTLDALGARIWDAPGADVSLRDMESWVRDRAVEGCRVIIVDPVTAADSGKEPWMADRRFVLNSKRLMREHGASLVVVTHPRDGNPKNGSRMDNHAGGQAYNRFTSCVLNLSMCQDDWATTVEFTAAGKHRSQAQINRRLSMHKTRSGTGQGWDIGFGFNANTLRFAEKGLLCDE